MKKIAMLLAVVFVCAIGAFAQTPNFAGTWKLDTSKLDEQRAARIESQTLTVEQGAQELKSTMATVLKAGAQGGGQGGPGGGGMGGGGNMTSSYKLDGSEVTTERDGPNGVKIPIKTTAKFDGGKLNISTSSTFNGPNGEMTTVSKSVWSLSGDGKTLTIKATRTGRNGEVTTESVYTKN